MMKNNIAYAEDGAVIIYATNTRNPFYVDEADFTLLLNYSWWEYGGGYLASSIDGQNKYLHQVLIPEVPEGYVIDHKDRDKSNNRRSNLRIITRGENSRNRTKHPEATSKFIGVRRISASSGKTKFLSIFNNKKLGRFDSEIVAAFIIDQKAKEYFGEETDTNLSRGLLTLEDVEQAKFILSKPIIKIDILPTVKQQKNKFWLKDVVEEFVIKQPYNEVGRLRSVGKGSTNFIGVSKVETRFSTKYKVVIAGKYIGSFDSEIEAAIASDKATLLHFGEIKTTNFNLGFISQEDLQRFGIKSIGDYHISNSNKIPPVEKKEELPTTLEKVHYEIEI